jgi:DNA repair protein RadC
MIVVKEIELRYKSKDSMPKDMAYIDSPKKVYDFLMPKVGTAVQEHFYAIYLNNKNKMIAWKEVSVGTISEAIVHPREIFSGAIEVLAVSVIIAHNHPSGELVPSHEDTITTNRVRDAGNILGIPVLDHIIITEEGYYSFKEDGCL